MFEENVSFYPCQYIPSELNWSWGGEEGVRLFYTRFAGQDRVEKSMKSDGWGRCWVITSLLGTGGDRVRVRRARKLRKPSLSLVESSTCLLWWQGVGKSNQLGYDTSSSLQPYSHPTACLSGHCAKKGEACSLPSAQTFTLLVSSWTMCSHAYYHSQDGFLEWTSAFFEEAQV